VCLHSHRLQSSVYQLALRIPGIFPSNASFRSMILLIRNFRYTPVAARELATAHRPLLNLASGCSWPSCALVVIRVFRSSGQSIPESRRRGGSFLASVFRFLSRP